MPWATFRSVAIGILAVVPLVFMQTSARARDVSVCATAQEGDLAVLRCPEGYTIVAIEFASYGMPEGSCGSFSVGECNATNPPTQCLGARECAISATNATFDDPCFCRYSLAGASTARRA